MQLDCLWIVTVRPLFKCSSDVGRGLSFTLRGINGLVRILSTAVIEIETPWDKNTRG
jgi:hypothetical protein